MQQRNMLPAPTVQNTVVKRAQAGRQQRQATWLGHTVTLLLTFSALALVLCALIFLVKAQSSRYINTGTSATPPAHVAPAQGGPSKGQGPTTAPGLDMGQVLKAAALLDPELMQHAPPLGSFDPAIRNPCWKANTTSGQTSQTRCLPYFYVTGMFHAGAGSLGQMLAKHPDVATDVCSNCQFWGEEGKPMKYYLDHLGGATQRVLAEPQSTIIMDNSASTFAFYWAAAGKTHRAFAESIRPCYEACAKASHEPGGKTIDTCMSETCFPAAQKADRQRAASSGIDYLADQHLPLLMRAVYGAGSGTTGSISNAVNGAGSGGRHLPRMVLLARDPLPRVYSSYYGYFHYHTKYGNNPQGFTAYVKETLGAFRACEATHGALQCALLFESLAQREEKVYYHCDQLMRGMYSVFLEIWMRYIPKEHWMVIKAEDYFADPKATLAKVVEFLGLPSPSQELLATMASVPPPKSYASGQPPMEPEAARLLADFYAPYNARLAELTGDKRFTSEWSKT